MIDDNGQPISPDLRGRINNCLKSHGYKASDKAVVEANWILNQAKVLYDEGITARAKSSRADAIDALIDLGRTYQDLRSRWFRVTRSPLAKQVLFEIARAKSGRHKDLFAFDKVIEGPIREVFRDLKEPAWQARIPVAPPGVASVKPLLPFARKLLQAIVADLKPTGGVARTRAAPSFAKQCEIVRDLLDIAGVSGISKRTLQNHHADIIPH